MQNSFCKKKLLIMFRSCLICLLPNHNKRILLKPSNLAINIRKYTLFSFKYEFQLANGLFQSQPLSSWNKIFVTYFSAEKTDGLIWYNTHGGWSSYHMRSYSERAQKIRCPENKIYWFFTTPCSMSFSAEYVLYIIWWDLDKISDLGLPNDVA